MKTTLYIDYNKGGFTYPILNGETITVTSVKGVKRALTNAIRRKYNTLLLWYGQFCVVNVTATTASGVVIAKTTVTL